MEGIAVGFGFDFPLFGTPGTTGKIQSFSELLTASSMVGLPKQTVPTEAHLGDWLLNWGGGQNIQTFMFCTKKRLVGDDMDVRRLTGLHHPFFLPSVDPTRTVLRTLVTDAIRKAEGKVFTLDPVKELLASATAKKAPWEMYGGGTMSHSSRVSTSDLLPHIEKAVQSWVEEVRKAELETVETLWQECAANEKGELEQDAHSKLVRAYFATKTEAFPLMLHVMVSLGLRIGLLRHGVQPDMIEQIQNQRADSIFAEMAMDVQPQMEAGLGKAIRQIRQVAQAQFERMAQPGGLVTRTEFIADHTGFLPLAYEGFGPSSLIVLKEAVVSASKHALPSHPSEGEMEMDGIS
eukprot:NODE_1942_length_1349_cov_35.136154_g1759_i0.p1 GENE.NODE_1942_length_1349_cov_35.136154_g1759_i0~~NODE_1942_length_1349_cov_35.136154_g1759_i0.p1  ORF type:complete len:394 (-),score=80.48 NODE_1942_length_1349_cov_35.136154_g1759_i0:168-1214(-)